MTDHDTTEQEQAGQISDPTTPNRISDADGGGHVSNATSEKGVISNETPEGTDSTRPLSSDEGTRSASTPEEDSQEPDTFPRDYVEKLRDESARYRQRAQQADEYAHRLHTALTAATRRLADPTDLPFDPEHLEDQDALTAALDDLVARKPHLAARKPHGSIGQGAQPHDPSSVDLAGLLRAGAGG
ncbi:FUSC family protein [Nesterenkonia marinintestina]|uniref:FUSC family protein n=1 Tax=Nesterenkonia marinintestina TaxID=2979865 RepID=UPI0021C14C50|nr:FUSC family protein [Nesterenkonia sp. GX14115]